MDKIFFKGALQIKFSGAKRQVAKTLFARGGFGKISTMSKARRALEQTVRYQKEVPQREA